MGIKDSKRTKVMPICKLCLQEKELCESHIIPKFVYRPVNDEKRREVVISENKYSIVQNGVKIPLLCKECEGKLSNYEMELKWFLKTFKKKILTILRKCLSLKVVYMLQRIMILIKFIKQSSLFFGG